MFGFISKYKHTRGLLHETGYQFTHTSILHFLSSLHIVKQQDTRVIIRLYKDIELNINDDFKFIIAEMIGKKHILKKLFFVEFGGEIEIKSLMETYR